MRRVDKILGDARALRVTRSLRAKGVEVGPMPKGGWMSEVAAGQALASALSVQLGENGARTYVDLSVLSPFIAKVRESIRAIFVEMRPQDLIGGPLGDRICAEFPVKGDVERARRHAAQDLGMLAAESVLFEAVRQVIRFNDHDRETRNRQGRTHVTVVNCKVRRQPRAKPMSDDAFDSLGMMSETIGDKAPSTT